MANPFTSGGTWYKGNLHTHTSNSDGRFTPQETIDLYAGAEYDFLALTDHLRLTNPSQLDSKGLVMVPGAEMHGAAGELNQPIHVVALGIASSPEQPQTQSIPQFVEEVADQCELCFTAHPYWSSIMPHELFGISRHIGLEVFNNTCAVGIGRGESAVHWDGLLARGRRLFGFAVDDAHSAYDDRFGGWIWLKAETLTVPNILTAIGQGQFYASSGPRITMIEYDEQEVHVQCSPCRSVTLVDPMPGSGRTSLWPPRSEGPVTDVMLPMREQCRIFRIECIDMEGRKAWSNPFCR